MNKKSNNTKAAARRVFDLSNELDHALDGFTCPKCNKFFAPPLTTRISPIDHSEMCESCAAKEPWA